jgi:flagellar secretion chaperone FliS
MNPYRAYSKPNHSSGSTRIDLLLAVYDKALLRLDQAEAAIKAGQMAMAVPLLAKAQFAVSTLAGGVRAGAGNEQGINMLRLYNFVVHELTVPRVEKVESARKILKTLRQGFEAIRAEANALERSGRLPSGDQLHLIFATA